MRFVLVFSMIFWFSNLQAIEDKETGLVISSGWDLVRAHCGSCHSHKLVTSQRADRQTWLSMIRWMQETQNLWDFDSTTENMILDYLTREYPPNFNRRRQPILPNLTPIKSVSIKIDNQ